MTKCTKKKISITRNDRVESSRSDFVRLKWHSPIIGQRFGRGTETTTSSSGSLDSAGCWHHDGCIFLEVCLCGGEDGVWRWDRIINIYMERKERYHQSEFRMLTGKWWKIRHRNVTTWQTYTYFLFAACKYIFLTFRHCLCFIYVLFNRQRWNLDVPLGACSTLHVTINALNLEYCDSLCFLTSSSYGVTHMWTGLYDSFGIYPVNSYFPKQTGWIITYSCIPEPQGTTEWVMLSNMCICICYIFLVLLAAKI